MTTLLVALAGAAVVAGILVVVAGVRRLPDQPARPRRSQRISARLARLDRRTKVLLLVGLVAGVVIWLLTGWAIALLVGPAAVAGVPYLLSAPTTTDIAKLDALKDWCWALKGSLTTGMGLEDAITASLSSTPEALRPEVTMLVHRIQARTRTVQALKAFAEDLNDATGDLVVAKLIVASKRRGQGLADLLGALAEQASTQVKVRQRIEADRNTGRSEARWVTVVTVLVLGGLALRGDYIAPYGTPIGQLLLAVLLGTYAALLVWMRQMAAGKPIPRFMALADSQEGAR
jgi:tight adherence protein B